ncbi:MAG: hypothetical protein Q8N16_03695 [bacterium]|nr:hypothetical protein [bacterium]
MPLIHRKKILIISLIALFCGLVFVDNYVRGETPPQYKDQEKPLACPAEKEVPVGQLCDQSVYTANKILTELKNMILAANQEYRAGKILVTLSTQCKTENCDSDCDPRTEYDTCTPFPPTDSWCSNHGGIALTVSYDVSNWAQCLAWCNTSMTSSLPLCQYNADGPRNCWVNYAPAGGIGNCIWNTSNPPYGAFWGPPTGTCPDGTTCYPEEPDQCPREVCDEEDCTGDACPFAAIDSANQLISSSHGIIVGAFQRLVDILEKRITGYPEMPLLVKDASWTICDVPILKLLCLIGGKPEPEILADLLEKSIDNVRDCRTSKFELELELLQGKTGKILLPCQEIMGEAIEKCYPNNYFCCQ